MPTGLPIRAMLLLREVPTLPPAATITGVDQIIGTMTIHKIFPLNHLSQKQVMEVDGRRQELVFLLINIIQILEIDKITGNPATVLTASKTLKWMRLLVKCLNAGSLPRARKEVLCLHTEMDLQAGRGHPIVVDQLIEESRMRTSELFLIHSM